MSLKRLLDTRTNVLAMSSTQPVKAAVDAMLHHKSGAVVLVTDDRKVIGIFTKRDLMGRVAARNLDVDTTPLGDVMTTEVVTLADSVSISDAISVMGEYRIRHLPVINAGDEFIGIVSLRFLLMEQIQDLRGVIQSLEGFLNDAPGG